MDDCANILIAVLGFAIADSLGGGKTTWLGAYDWTAD